MLVCSIRARRFMNELTCSLTKKMALPIEEDSRCLKPLRSNGRRCWNSEFFSIVTAGAEMCICPSELVKTLVSLVLKRRHGHGDSGMSVFWFGRGQMKERDQATAFFKMVPIGGRETLQNRIQCGGMWKGHFAESVLKAFARTPSRATWLNPIFSHVY